MNMQLQELVSDLNAADDLDQFWTRINAELSQYGVNSIFYGAIAAKNECLVAASPMKSVFWKTNHTHDFVDHFGYDALLDNCLTFEHSLRSTKPFLWHDISLWDNATPCQRVQD